MSIEDHSWKRNAMNSALSVYLFVGAYVTKYHKVLWAIDGNCDNILVLEFVFLESVLWSLWDRNCFVRLPSCCYLLPWKPWFSVAQNTSLSCSLLFSLLNRNNLKAKLLFMLSHSFRGFSSELLSSTQSVVNVCGGSLPPSWDGQQWKGFWNEIRPQRNIQWCAASSSEPCSFFHRLLPILIFN